MSAAQAKSLFVRSPFAIFIVTGLISFLVVVGWQANAPSLVRVLPFLPPVRFNCAVLQLLSATSLLLLNLERRRLALLFSSAIIVFSFAFLIQHLFKCDLGIDSLLAPSHVFAQDSHPGRISLFGSIGFLMVGLSGVLLSLPFRHWKEGMIGLAAAICMAMGVSAAIGLSIGLHDLGPLMRFHGITPQGSFFFTFIGVGILWQLRNVRFASGDETHLAAIVRQSDEAIYSINLDGKVLSWNRAAEKLYGYSAQEILGTSVLQLSAADKWNLVISAIEQVKQGTALSEFEGWRLRKNGEPILLSFTVSPVRDESGKVVQLSVVGRDITERKRHQEQTQREALELSRSNQELEQFAAVASHDLQEPLRMISSYLHLLSQRYQQKLDQDAKDFIHFAADGAGRMKLLVEGLLSYSRVGNKTLQLKAVDLHRLAQLVKLNLQQAIRENDAKITFENLCPIVADEIQLLQILQNLILNGIKYRRETRPEIQVRLEQLPDKFLFKVSDNGIGISASDQQRLFKLFHRLQYRDKCTGAGIGLATCKKIVERHGGKIWVESEVDSGTHFFFTIPRDLSVSCNPARRD